MELKIRTVVDGYSRRQGFPGGSGVKNLPANPRDAGDTGTVHGIAKSQT